MSSKTCKQCNAVLTTDDIAIYLKLVSRNAKEYLCIDCLGQKLKCGREPIEERIRYYKEYGTCSLFRVKNITKFGGNNLRYDICIFDLDGTLSNPCEGLINGIRYMLDKLNIDYEIVNPGLFIGPPLHESFKRELNLTDEQTEIAVSTFREYYSETGLYENELYPGIVELLRNLQSNNINLAVATTKPDKFARLVLKHFNILNYFDAIQGDTFDFDISKTGKTPLINTVLDKIDPARKKNAVMIGDRHHDINGAKNAGIDSIGILWGYGSHDEFKDAGATHIADSTEQLQRLLLS